MYKTGDRVAFEGEVLTVVIAPVPAPEVKPVFVADPAVEAAKEQARLDRVYGPMFDAAATRWGF